jgi:hypothetical protein
MKPRRVNLRHVEARARRASAALDAYATAVEEFAAKNSHRAAWREADDVRRLIVDVRALVAECRAARERA